MQDDFSTDRGDSPSRAVTVAFDYDAEREAMGHPSQVDLAESFVRYHRGRFAWDRRAAVWRQWDSARWTEADGLIRDVSYHVRGMLGLDATAADKKAWLNLATFKAVAELAREGLSAEWDSGPLVGLASGAALDTDTGDLVPNEWWDFISRYIPEAVATDSEAPSERWGDFMLQALSHYGNADRLAVYDYLQQWCGSALSGDCRDEAMLFLYGPPSTGKSTFVETVLACFGEYGSVIAGERVATVGQHLQWLAGLRGKRIVAITELPARGTWQTSALNQLVSGEMVEANRMRSDSINFRSRAHVIATGNHRPRASAGSGLWRRMRLIQFQNQPTPDLGLKGDLQEQLPGIFNWILTGLYRWIANGRKLTTPGVLLRDTEAYRASADPVHDFIVSKAVVEAQASVTVADLYNAFHDWWLDNVSDKPMGKRSFSERLDDLGFEKAEVGLGGKARLRHGLALRKV